MQHKEKPDKVVKYSNQVISIILYVTYYSRTCWLWNPTGFEYFSISDRFLFSKGTYSCIKKWEV